MNTQSTGGQAVNDPQAHHTMTQRILTELRAALLPVLIALLAWLGAGKLNSIEAQLQMLPEYTRELAVLQAQLTERQNAIQGDRVKLDRVEQHVLAIDRRVQTLEAEQAEADRRLSRLER